MDERCDRSWESTGDVEPPALETLGALGIPEGATRVAFISADIYRREVALAALRVDPSVIMATATDARRRVVSPAQTEFLG
jgi:hypothetical protein